MKLFDKYVKPYMKVYARAIFLAVLFGFLTVFTNSALTFTSGYLISSASITPYNILALYVPVVLVRAFGISQAVTRYIERLIGHNTVLRILSDMRVRLYSLLEPQALLLRSRYKTGDLLGTLSDDIEHLQDIYIRTIFPTIVALSVFAGCVISLAVFDWLFALWIAFLLAIIVFVYPWISYRLMKRHQIQQKDVRGRLYAKLTDAVMGISDWIISGKRDRFMEQFVGDNIENLAMERKQRYWHQSRELQLRILSGIVLIFMGIWSGSMALAGEFAPAYIAAFTLVTLPVIDGLIPISLAVERTPTYQGSLTRLAEIEKSVPPEIKGIVGQVEEKADIIIDQVAFRYAEGQEDAVKNITLHIPHKTKIALLGKSGAGKSTLLRLLQGALAPTKGKITINGYTPQEYGDKIYEVISVLDQKPYLFSTTVANNIRLGKRNASLEEVEEVIKQVELDKYIHSLPKGLQTEMYETGARFSGGERQRIALARILLKNTPVVILDEPTVGLDPQTEYALVETIFDVLKDKTVIWITHHLTGIEKMDKVIFMDKGEIVMSGHHDELMKTSERYRQLYEMDRGGM